MSPAEAARQYAAATVRQQLGLPASSLSWTREQRIDFNKRLAAYLLANPIGIDAETMRQASAVSNKTYEALADDSFSWVEFGDEFVNNAAKISTGFTGKVLNGVAVALVVWLVFKVFNLRRDLK